ncbi:intracellular ribonuclease LX-like [Dioscorea cayenensis subsp. rotundata]|uniref:Intracellular ribonuclease LX-like n=1 Tax=Dioscorea cayennensis subsp. rotundata TaxID=55577 RepID=A0AB40AUA9_DIOCR|nr:intracellular ribonuclease LX-like [Dioscorea cayenensis subsp. rotundata]
MAFSCVTALTLFMGMMLFASSLLVSAANVDFLYLVLMWPRAYCSQSVCCRPTTGMPAEDFFIRGLWTYNEAGKPVTRCTREPYNSTEMEGLEPELYEYWSSIKCPSNDGSLYWKKAWKTYGTCTGMYQPTYFETALDLRAQVDLLTALANKGITPSETRKYSMESIEKAIEEATKSNTGD